MADKCPAAAVIAAIRASGGVLRRQPDGKGARGSEVAAARRPSRPYGQQGGCCRSRVSS